MRQVLCRICAGARAGLLGLHVRFMQFRGRVFMQVLQFLGRIFMQVLLFLGRIFMQVLQFLGRVFMQFLCSFCLLSSRF